VKSKKLPLLIALIALIGTVTAILPQQISADFEATLPAGILCESSGAGLFDDTHQIRTPGEVFDPVAMTTDLTMTIDLFGPEVGGNPTLATTNDGAAWLVDSTDTIIRFQFLNPPADETAIPRPIIAFFEDVPQGIFDIVFCMSLDQEFDDNGDPVFENADLGFKHSEVRRILLDDKVPVGECTNREVTLDEGETEIDKADTRLDPFFDGVSFDDNVDTDLGFNARDFGLNTFPLGPTDVTFEATDDADNTGSVTCRLTIVGGDTPGCEGVQLDIEGEPLELEFCVEIPVGEPECILGFIGQDPITLNYGQVEQSQVSLAQLLQIENLGDAPGLIKVFGEAWVEDETTIVRMLTGATHFSLEDPDTIIQSELQTFYDDDTRSFALTEIPIPGKKVIIPILLGEEIVNTHWMLRIDLLDDTFFGNMKQTKTFELQQCSESNLCETLGFRCPEAGEFFVEGNGNGFGR